jgi:hypothetical protein
MNEHNWGASRGVCVNPKWFWLYWCVLLFIDIYGYFMNVIFFWKKRGNGFTLMHLGNAWILPKPKYFSHNLLSVQMLPSTQNRIVSSVLWVKVTRIMIWVWINTYRYSLLGGWTSINPSYFDVNYRGTRFWPTAIWLGESTSAIWARA